MNKALYNWLDNVEGLAIGTTAKSIAREIARQGKGECTHIYQIHTQSRCKKCIKCSVVKKDL